MTTGQINMSIFLLNLIWGFKILIDNKFKQNKKHLIFEADMAKVRPSNLFLRALDI